MNCYEAIDLMGDAIESRVPSDSRAGFQEHLDECPACCTYFEQLRTTVSALARLPRRGDPVVLTQNLRDAYRRRSR
ncbi:MAG TPA: zf-HC2 domain-containing protein [Candidatus Eisenbacteria bacterium]|jgi:predicted anti-sigma-YlaC factor YlaD|nr:zf-HC2 domain-containing protein [Candidatus Eisenbacteria bacterium]